MASDIIDFQSERGRHEELLGRDDVLAEMNALLLGEPSRGWVLVKGGPGMGKSALLAEWLKRREAAGYSVPPHHFLRRGIEDWDRPEVVKRNLAAQVERLFPALADPEARPESRLRELLQRVSKEVLTPRRERLVLVVDGLDEVEGEPDGSNPLRRFLPNVLPPGVKVLCASRPMYPYLSWLEGLDNVRTVDLDGERWLGSNKEVVRQYIRHLALRFVPPLTPTFVSEAVEAAAGNVLYAVKLAEWLQDQPVEKRRVELLPRGLEALLEESWDQLQRFPGELRAVALKGLGLVAVAREALPLSVLALVAQWTKSEDTDFLRVASSFLLEEPGRDRSEKAWRPFHESFRSFIASKLGPEKERELHQRLAEHLCQWPVERAERGFHRSYALRHGVTHWLKAGEWKQARRLYSDMGYLEEQCRLAGALSVDDTLKRAAVEGPATERELPEVLHLAVLAESHRLKMEPKSLPLLIYNRLRASGWTKPRIEQALHFPSGLPAFRLRHPVKAGMNERTLEGHGHRVMGCAVTPDGQHVVSASWDNMLKVWDLKTGREVVTLEGHGAGVNGCAVTPDGRHVVSVSRDNTLRVWDLESGRQVATLGSHGDSVKSCVMTPDGRRVVSASGDCRLKVWDLESGQHAVTMEGCGGSMNGCAVTPDGRRMVSASDDHTLKVWDLESGRQVATLEGHDGGVNGCAVTPDGRRVVSASDDHTLRVWDLQSGRHVATLEGHKHWVNDCKVTPDGRLVVSASADRTLKVWDLESGRQVATLEGHGGNVNGCAVTPDGRRVVSASDDRTLKVWDLESEHVTAPLAGHSAPVMDCAVTPDGQRVVSASDDRTLKVWDLESGRQVATLEGHHGGVNGCAVTPDGQHVVSASDDYTLGVWDLESGRHVATMQNHGSVVKGCTVTPDGRHVVSASYDCTLEVKHLETGRWVATLRGHGAGVNDCAVTPDGRYVVSASDDRTLRVWELKTGQQVATLEGHEGSVNGCAVAPDGRRMVSASEDRTLKLWDLETARQVRACRKMKFPFLEEDSINA
jgi:WD40 repeat protein